jgi:hypothetical protein
MFIKTRQDKAHSAVALLFVAGVVFYQPVAEDYPDTYDFTLVYAYGWALVALAVSLFAYNIATYKAHKAEAKH